jgi:hypothetical protein
MVFGKRVKTPCGVEWLARNNTVWYSMARSVQDRCSSETLILGCDEGR